MINLSFYLENWILPMAIVGLIYFIFLVPIYFLIKKYKPNYWLMVGTGILVVYLVGVFLYFIEVQSNFDRFFAYIFFSSFLTSFVFFISFPLFLNKINKTKIDFKILSFSYLILFAAQCLYVYLILITIAWGASSFIH